MSLIPFILDLADELQEYQRCLFAGGGAVGAGLSSMDIDDVDLSAALEQQLQQELTTTPLLQSSSSSSSTSSPSPPPPASTSSPLTSRQRLLSQLYWPTNIVQKHQPSHHQKHAHHHQHHHQLSQRHHPYAQTARLNCCKDVSSKLKSNLIGGFTQTQKPTTTTSNMYPIIQKNGWMMVSMNVKQFAPDELMVKTIDNCIIVEGRHEDKEDIHGVISRHFIRKYMLPNDYDPNEVVSTLSSDGILTVKAPPPAASPQPQTAMDTNEQEIEERFVDIQQQEREQEQQQEQTGPAQIAVKQTAPTETPTTTTSSQQSPTTVEPTKTPPEAAAAATAVTEVEQPISPKIDAVEVSVDEKQAKAMAVDDEPLEALREMENSTAAAAADTLLELKVADEFTTAVGVAAAAAPTTAMECLEKSEEVAVTATEKLDVAVAPAAVEELITAPKKTEMQVDAEFSMSDEAVAATAAAVENVAAVVDEQVTAKNGVVAEMTEDKPNGEKNGNVENVAIDEAETNVGDAGVAVEAVIKTNKIAAANILTDEISKNFVANEPPNDVKNVADVAIVADVTDVAVEKNGLVAVVDGSNGANSTNSNSSVVNDEAAAIANGNGNGSVVVGIAAIDALPPNAAAPPAATAAEELVAN